MRTAERLNIAHTKILARRSDSRKPHFQATIFGTGAVSGLWVVQPERRNRAGCPILTALSVVSMGYDEAQTQLRLVILSEA